MTMEKAMFCGSQADARQGRVIVGRLSKYAFSEKWVASYSLLDVDRILLRKALKNRCETRGSGLSRRAGAAAVRPRAGLRWGAFSLGGINVVVPQGWSVETCSSRCAWLEHRLPSAEGDGTLAVFRFGPGQGGGVEANLDRWLGQFQQPDGRDSRDVARLWTEGVDGLSAHLVDVSASFPLEQCRGER